MEVPRLSPLESEMLKEILIVNIHVVLTASLTALAWTCLYGAKCDIMFEMYSNFLFDLDHQNTTGYAFFDGLLNALIVLLTVALMTFLLAKLVIKHLKWVVVFILKSSQMLLNLMLPLNIFRDLFESIGFEGNNFAVGSYLALVAIYFLFSYLTFYTDLLPAQFHRLFIVFNCSFVATMYLRILSRHTIWIMLIGSILWDLYAMRYANSPLRNIMEHANEYGDQMIRFLAFSATETDPTETDEQRTETDGNVTELESFEDASSKEDTSSEAYKDKLDGLTSLRKKQQEKKRQQEKNQHFYGGGTRTAQDALNSGGTRLGMGDFVFFGLLFAKAWADGSLFSASATLVGIVVGVTISLLTSFLLEELGLFFYLPALPVSLALGMTVHFGTTFFEKAFNSGASGGDNVTMIL